MLFPASRATWLGMELGVLGGEQCQRAPGQQHAAHCRFGLPNRWEGALEPYYGQCQDRVPAHGAGRMAIAQDRGAWKSFEAAVVGARGRPLLAA